MLELRPPTRKSGRHAQARGDDAEDAVEALHASRAFEISEPGAWLIRRHARKTMTPQGWRHTAPQGPDFGGGVVRAGRAIACEIEVKFCERKVGKRGQLLAASLAFERFTDAEVKYLGACARAGGIAVVLVLAGVNVAYATWHAVPWRAIEGDVLAWRAASLLARREKELRASVTQLELEGWAVRARERYLQAEWLR